MSEVFADSINELHERIKRLENRRLEIIKEREKKLKIPAVTESMVNDILHKVRAMFDITDYKELKVALSHFIERIEIDGRDVTIQYSFRKPEKNVLPSGDPGGI